MKKTKEKTNEELANEWLLWFKDTPSYKNMKMVCPTVSLDQSFFVGFMAAKGEFKK